MNQASDRKEIPMQRMYRQGDVLLVASKIPEGTKLAKRSRVRVAEGEATGHAHVLEPTEDATVLVDVDAEFVRIMGANGLLVHDEHTAIAIPEGDYQVVRQREYAPEENRFVAD